MATPTDSGQPLGLPRRELAHLIRRHCEAVMRRWEPAARAALTGAQGTPRLILIDFLQEALQELADRVERQHEGTAAACPDRAPETAYAAIHGSGRAAVPDYDVAQVVHEYRLLRQSLIEVLSQETTLTAADVYALTDYIDQAIEQAVGAFTKSLREAQLNQVRGLVHDLLNPLAGVRMHVQLIRRRANDPDRIKAFADDALRATERIESMTRALLDAARLQAGEALKLHFEHVDLRDLVNGVIESARIAHGDRFRLRCPDAPVTGRFAPTGVVRILENLTANAVQHSESEAEITITVTDAPEKVLLAVQNWGEPIPSDQRDQLFGEFFQVRRRDAHQAGWGLGLGIVQAVAEAHSGSVTVESDTESGTTFTITLPKDGGKAAEELTAL